jgi:5-methylthioadenosine/S-adenosylhomocysteine deaminase
MSGDMIEAMRWSVAMQRVRAGGEFVVQARTALAWATQAGADALGLGAEVGSLEAGKRADLILLDATSPTMAPVVDGIGIIVYSATGHDVDTVIVNGKVLLYEGRLVTSDGPEIVRTAQAVAEALWERAGRSCVTRLDREV